MARLPSGGTMIYPTDGSIIRNQVIHDMVRHLFEKHFSDNYDKSNCNLPNYFVFMGKISLFYLKWGGGGKSFL